MSAPTGMTRLARLYARVEQMRSLERRVAALAVDEAHAALTIHTAIYADALADIRTSLAAGDREQWAISSTAQVITRRHLEHLASLRAKREATLSYAVEAHRESRLTMEQIERLIANAEAKIAVGQGRREQAIADDRFASRAAWTRAKTLE